MSTNGQEIKTIDPPGCDLIAGMILNESCPTCGHMVSAHIWPSAVCTQCWEEDKYAKLEARIEELEKDRRASVNPR